MCLSGFNDRALQLRGRDKKAQEVTLEKEGRKAKRTNLHVGLEKIRLGEFNQAIYLAISLLSPTPVHITSSMHWWSIQTEVQ